VQATVTDVFDIITTISYRVIVIHPKGFEKYITLQGRYTNNRVKLQ
jgi:hypothetical protein